MEASSRKSSKKTATLVGLISLLGIGLLVLLEIVYIDNPGTLPGFMKHRGWIFSVFLLLGLWSIYAYRRGPVGQRRSIVVHSVKFLLACYAVGAIVFIGTLLVSMFFFDANGVTFVSSNIFTILAVGMLLGAPLVYRYLE